MDTPEVRRALRAAGGRWTVQRAAILEAIARREGHFTAGEIHDEVHGAHPGVERSTVYRTLDLLVELEAVASSTGADGLIWFERLGDAPHHHLVCTGCGVLVEVDDDVFEPVRTSVAERYGFQADLAHLMLPGRCAGCTDGPGPSTT